MKSLTIVHLFIVIAFLIAPFAGHADCSRIFVVGTNTDAVAKKRAGINAISIELFSEIKKRVNCVYNERTLSFTKALEELRNNRIDIFAFAFKAPEWTAVTNSEVLYSVSRILLVSKGVYKKEFTISDYIKNPKIKFGVVSGGMFFTNKDELDLLEKEKRAVYDPFPDGVIELLTQRKVQAVFTSPTFYRRYVKQFKLAELTEAIPDKNNNLDLTLFFSKTRVKPEEQKIFADAIKSMRKDGFIRKTLLKYVLEDDVNKYYTF
ncbi:ABC transporter substrate-binding protein [Bdellovibrio sp. NC01]|uniref:substrate-binding periplasmic protein n=1 Tax=Bdellovibrio sp. NC01 TaxID=2220073 RepID=UPI00115BFBCB|nr:ABC transporter substrate-binding protein [Bdellovibrio sp. NC01]QDK37576.1 hypothetical protein DOE51_08250 [Bdellovibrio sp. NC01]